MQLYIHFFFPLMNMHAIKLVHFGLLVHIVVFINVQTNTSSKTTWGEGGREGEAIKHSLCFELASL